ncbi:MAG: protein-disulfide reductase DsbD [Candidatus Competibacterales bacterium]|nr:protein-disulfide reductase DsbD [Candidatus Competibacterales bacterium]
MFGLLLLILAVPAAALQPEDLLRAEQAFALSVQAAGPEQVVAEWDIAEGYYLYRDRFGFSSGTPGVRVGEPRFPAGKLKNDEFFGEMVVYYDRVRVVLPVERAPDAPTRFRLETVSQGCAEVGVCYPPRKQAVQVALADPGPGGGLDMPDATAGSDPAGELLNGLLAQPDLPQSTAPAAPESARPAAPAVTAAAPPVRADAPVSEQDAIARMLTERQFWALPAFFGFGLLLAFTPCVFPMIPILSGIIAGHGNTLTRSRAFLLSSVYVLAMALTYTAAGVGAALAGQNVQIWFQNPWVLGAFSGLFVLLALAMFGLFNLQLPATLQTRLARIGNRRGGSYAGVALMGLLSALIVGPCVAPPLIGALTVIGLSGDPTLGGSALFAMSLGMGVPLIAIGTSAGHWLPRAGAWMDTVRAVFGVLLLAVALWLLERILPPVLVMLGWAVLLIVCAVYMGALNPVEGRWRTLGKGLGTVLLVYGVLLLVGVAAGGRDIWQPLRGVLYAGGGAITAPAEPAFRPVKGLEGLQRQLTQADGRPVMLDFYADWCVSCKEMEKYTFSDPAVRAALEPAVLLQTDVTDNDARDQALLRRFDLIGPPAILFFDGRGSERPGYRVVGYMPADEFRRHAARAIGETALN